MKQDKKNIDQFFLDQLDGLMERPPAYVWDGVETALDEKAAVNRLARKRRNRFAIALLLLLTGGSATVLWEAMDVIDSDTVAVVEKKTIDKKDQPAAPVAVSDNNIAFHQKNAGNAQTQADHIISSGNEKASSEPAAVASFTGKQEARPVDGLSSNTVDHFQPGELMAIDAEKDPSLLKDAPTILTVKQKTILPPAANGLAAVNSAKAVQVKRPSRFSLTAFFAPDITTRNLEQDRGNTADEGKEVMNKTEKNGALDFTFGARVDYKINKRFSLQSGISFSTNTIDIAEKTVYARYDRFGALAYKFNMSSGYSFFKLKKIPAPQFAGDSTRSSGSTSTLHYVNIPIALKYNFYMNKRVTLYLHAGGTARFITGESIATTYDYNGQKERSISEEIEGLKKNYFNGVVGVGAEYALSKHVAVTLFPSFNFATSSINQNAPVKAYPNTLSIASGIRFNF